MLFNEQYDASRAYDVQIKHIHEHRDTVDT